MSLHFLNIFDYLKLTYFWPTFSTEWFACRRLINRGKAAPFTRLGSSQNISLNCKSVSRHFEREN